VKCINHNRILKSLPLSKKRLVVCRGLVIGYEIGVFSNLKKLSRLFGSPRTVRFKLNRFRKINSFLKNRTRRVWVCFLFFSDFLSKNFAKIVPGVKEIKLNFGVNDSKLTCNFVSLKYSLRLTKAGLDKSDQV
jgi:hypothetical protein